MKNQELATKINQLMTEQGLSLEQALDQLKVKAPGSSRPKIEDRVAYIKGLTSIPEVRKASKAAYAKRSKAKDEDGDDKYGREISAARDRLDELNKIISESADPLAKALEFEETPEGIVQRALDLFNSLDDELNPKLKKMGLTKKQAKDLMAGYPADTIPTRVKEVFEKLGDAEKYLTIWASRSNRRDQRVITINRTLAFLENCKEAPAPKKAGTSKPRKTSKK